MNITGSIVALVTPMHADGSVDVDALRGLIDWHAAEGTDCVSVVGTTGESPTVTHDEQHEIISVAVEHARTLPRKLPIMAGAGSNSTAEAISLQRYCRQVGADCSLQVVPYYNRPSQEGLYQHFKAIAESCDLPTVLYNVPGRTVADLAHETVLRLAEIPNIVGIKDATGNIERGARLIKALAAKRPDFKVYSGDDGTAAALMLLGGHGNISVTANVAPRLMRELCAAALAGDARGAAALHHRLSALNAALFCEPSPAPAKWALQRLGKIEGGLRLPLVPLSAAGQSLVQSAMQEAGVIG
jgi:4-hydroxy-tetrahydrodipicolinate synthase